MGFDFIAYPDGSIERIAAHFSLALSYRQWLPGTPYSPALGLQRASITAWSLSLPYLESPIVMLLQKLSPRQTPTEVSP